MIPLWTFAQDLVLGDQLLGFNGELITVQTKKTIVIETGIDVFHLSTEQADPFFVEDFLVRAYNDTKSVYGIASKTIWPYSIS
jgi:hypothetical protein